MASDSSVVADSSSVALPAEAHLAWKHIITPAEPFLRAVIQSLKDQISAFERDIAVYAEYALTNQGKQLRPALVALRRLDSLQRNRG